MAKRQRRMADMESNVIEISHGWHPPSSFKKLTSNHYRLIQSIKSNPITIVNGPAGSLKTFLSLQTAIALVADGWFNKILYIRQNIQRPNEKGLGFLPGEKSDKLSPLLRPIRDNLEAIMPLGQLEQFLAKGLIEGSDLETIRGRSPLNTILICDESQNVDLVGLETVMTRRAESSKLIMVGDYHGQRDINSRDFDAFELVCKEFAGVFSLINFNKNDILRADSCKDVIEGFERIRAGLADQPI
jgi:phosphate starvation-inducible PhoH-like protein